MSATRVVSSTEVRTRLPSLLSQIEELKERVIITRRGKPLAIMLGYAEYEGLLNTMEVLSDPDLIRAAKEGERDVEKGDFVSLDQYLADREKGLA